MNALVVTHGANVDAVDEYGRAALMIAAWKGDTDIVTALAGTRGANVDAVDRGGWTALMLAAYPACAGQGWCAMTDMTGLST